MRKKYLVNGKEFDVLCDASELSYQLSRQFRETLTGTLTETTRLIKVDDLSWGIYNPTNREWLFVSKVTVINNN